MKIVCLIALLVSIAAAPGFAAEARHRHGDAPAFANARTLAARKSVTHRKPAGATRSPVARDAIGRPVPAPKSPAAIDAAHAGPAPRMPAKSIGAVAPAGPSSFNRAAWPKSVAVGAPHAVAQLQHPLGGASLAGRGRIDGAALIRPRLAPSALGGPARMSGGIDGTDFHPKH